ncbi:SDR family NAD(P)-dependent oxidoreductase [Paenibacillus prosopidis]|uniref:NAD(P)-dependent dehydrogenase (Short-subunit alcohol dehydrogenase family) n=1 Tax=Paenibacillus prosopidis TaxID=630520 RepID=A0A368VSM0_9BACL|nr:glucose 1-dehydrogenase [Paenibacillus prosopidis]RCW42453.1 NAD(P)-dependent dehydrogenase (short-subunit alcohol dehydrogenase family) [Paenibacillus prosopidis]
MIVQDNNGMKFQMSAFKLAQLGAKVVITGRRNELGNQAVRDIVAQGGDALFLQSDVNSEKEVQEMIETTISHYGKLNILVNNAGVSLETLPIAHADGNLFQQMLQTNVMGIFFCMKHAIQQMLKQGEGGSIVNLASIAGLNGMPYAGPYAATKHAVVGLTKSAALEYATENIRVNAVAPGAIKTDIITKSIEQGTYNEDIIVQMHPMMRMGRPQEIADGIVWLCSDEASFATGTILNMDGGFTAK